MAEIVIAGNTSGSVTIAAPDAAGTTTLTLPATSGALVAENGSGTVEVGNVTASGTVTATSLVGDGSGITGLVIPPEKSIQNLEIRSTNVTYTASTDGFFVGNVTNGGAIYGGFYIYIDGAARVWSRTPSTGAAGWCTGMYPVKAGQTYNATRTGGGAGEIQCSWIPFN